MCPFKLTLCFVSTLHTTFSCVISIAVGTKMLKKSVKSQSSQFSGNAEEEGGFAQQSCSTTMALVLILIIGVSLFLRPINEGLKPKPPSIKQTLPPIDIMLPATVAATSETNASFVDRST